MRRLLIAGVALLTVPTTLLAQPDKADKDKKKDDLQQVIVTRTGDKSEKMTIEIEGDKVKINGKDVKELKDVNVHVSSVHSTNGFRVTPSARGTGTTWNYDYDDDHASLFSEDENRAMLGVTTEGNDKGAEIKSITKESAAEKAGLKKGDILTKIAETKIESTDDVTDAIHAQKPGDKISITYLRDGKEQKVTAELGKWKGIKMNSVSMPRLNDTWVQGYSTPSTTIIGQGGGFYFGGRPRLGLSIQDTEDGVGVKVLDVEDESPSAKAGLKEDDIIVGVDDHEVRGTEDVTKTVKENKEKTSFVFKVKRDGKTQNIEVKFPKKLKTTDL